MKTVITLMVSTLKQYLPSLKGIIVLLFLLLGAWVWSQPTGQTTAHPFHLTQREVEKRQERLQPTGQTTTHPFHLWRISHVVTAFESAGLQVEIVHTGNRSEDDGLSMFMAVDTARFRILSAGDNESGIILSFYNYNDLADMKNYYLMLNKSLPEYSSWVFVKDNILVQINRSLPAGDAQKYKAALDAIGKQERFVLQLQW